MELASELDRLQTLVRELEARVADDHTPAAARQLCGALAASADRAVRLAGNRNVGPGKKSRQPRNSARKAAAAAKVRRQTMARELEARVVDEHTPAAARQLCSALAASVDRAVRLAGNGNAGPGKKSRQPRNSARKAPATAKVRRQVRVASVQDTRPLDDGLSWRKYGQKDILGTRYPRSYFRCTHQHTRGCQATKQVQRADADPLLFDVVYNGVHTCIQGTAPSLLTSPGEQQPPASGQAQRSPAPEGIQWWPVDSVTPPGTIDGYCPPASSLYDLAGSYDYAASAGLVADMELEAQLDEFFLNPSEFFQPEIQSL